MVGAQPKRALPHGEVLLGHQGQQDHHSGVVTPASLLPHGEAGLPGLQHEVEHSPPDLGPLAAGHSRYTCAVLQCSAVQCRAVRCNTARCSAVQCSAVRSRAPARGPARVRGATCKDGPPGPPSGGGPSQTVLRLCNGAGGNR
jgi:hypothetical protein